MAAEQDPNMNIPKPRVGPFEVNLNTVVVFLGFASGFVAWGYTISEVKSGLGHHTSGIERLDNRLTALETQARLLDNHELRIRNVEERATGAAQAMQSVQTTLNALGTDIQVVKEILQRLENGQTVIRPAPSRQ